MKIWSTKTGRAYISWEVPCQEILELGDIYKYDTRKIDQFHQWVGEFYGHECDCNAETTAWSLHSELVKKKKRDSLHRITDHFIEQSHKQNAKTRTG